MYGRYLQTDVKPGLCLYQWNEELKLLKCGHTGEFLEFYGKKKTTNKEVLKSMNINTNSTELLRSIKKKKKLSHFGHTKRHEPQQKLILEGKVDGSRGRGRRRKSWTTNIAELTNMRLNAAAKAAMEREGWRSMASNLFKEKEPS
ncbi:endonuclease-reverse transcriptase [Elysia marginata]|uniref:Endonuclease-reverse transcriptase n=1 Tax=Elysia marginata TaxID=1093978 RepID=A0AAV4IT29_9GAST|nr:endonuclease-reverse transcriptase [Elysia marginata]